MRKHSFVFCPVCVWNVYMMRSLWGRGCVLKCIGDLKRNVVWSGFMYWGSEIQRVMGLFLRFVWMALFLYCLWIVFCVIVFCTTWVNSFTKQNNEEGTANPKHKLLKKLRCQMKSHTHPSTTSVSGGTGVCAVYCCPWILFAPIFEVPCLSNSPFMYQLIYVP